MACGYGKVILFGEHAVVYGYPALAAGLKVGINCKVVSEDEKFSISIPDWNLEIDEKTESPLGCAFRIILSKISGIKQCRMEIKPDIPSRAGLGSSAATIVSIIRSLIEWHNLNWTNQQINELALEAETSFHGTPSGIDNTVSTYGGLCFLCDSNRFELPQGKLRIQLKKVAAVLLPQVLEPIRIIVINTKRQRETKNLIEHVKQKLSEDEAKYLSYFDKIGSFSVKGYDLLRKKDHNNFGKLMLENHYMLQNLGVSCKELDMAFELVMKEGAIGAKLTGAGGGGCLIALSPGNESKIIED